MTILETKTLIGQTEEEELEDDPVNGDDGSEKEKKEETGEPDEDDENLE